MINTKNQENLYLYLTKKDKLTPVKSLLEKRGYIMRLEDGKLVPRLPSVGYDAPWVYVQAADAARCDLYTTVFFKTLRWIHSYCRECYKIVVRPQTVVDLFKLYELQREMGVPCKCGLERRNTVCGLYGGYFYTRGIEQGRRRYKQVREFVDERLSPDTPVILKRYCTEMETCSYDPNDVPQGPSNETPDVTKEQREWELEVEAMFPKVGYGNKQPDWLIANRMREWIHFAYQQGDLTYKELTGGSDLFPHYVTYHDGE